MRKAAPVQTNSKKLKIQIGVCKRLIKEVASYKAEVIKNEAKVQKMRDEGKDIYDIRKQEEVLQESYMMVPDSQSRLEAAMVELQNIINECAEDPEADTALVTEATALIDESAAAPTDPATASAGATV